MAAYYVWSGAGGSANGTSWANAYTTLTLAFSGKAAGDIFYVAQDHAESVGSALTLTTAGTLVNPAKVICVDRAGSVPPVSADRRATGQVTTTAASAINLAGSTHWDGIIFNAGTGATGANFGLPSATAWLRLDNCSLRLNTTGAGVIQLAGGSGNTGYVELNNTTVSFAAVSQSINIAGVLKWRNTPSAIIGAAVPTILFQVVTGTGGELECIGVDFSTLGSGKTLVGSGASTGSNAHKYRLVDCKLNASVTRSAVPLAIGGMEVDFVRSGAGGNNAVYRDRISGQLTEETTIVRTGGATDGTTSLAWRIVTTANCNYSVPFECPPIAIWNDTTGSAVTVTVEGIGAALPTDAEVWLDVEYLGDASSPQGSFAGDGKADLLATAANQTSSSAVWGGSTAAFKLNVTFTPQQKGWIYARVKIGKASSTFYIDPKITLT